MLTHDLAKDIVHLSTGFLPLTLLSTYGGPALAVSLLNIINYMCARVSAARWCVCVMS